MHKKTVHLHNDVQGDGSNSSRRSTVSFPFDDGEVTIFHCCWTIHPDHDDSGDERTYLKVLNLFSKHLLPENVFTWVDQCWSTACSRWK